MSTYRITINTDNAAFNENPYELRNILQRLADNTGVGYGKLTEAPIRGTNGNTVGRVERIDDAAKASRARKGA